MSRYTPLPDYWKRITKDKTGYAPACRKLNHTNCSGQMGKCQCPCHPPVEEIDIEIDVSDDKHH